MLDKDEIISRVKGEQKSKRHTIVKIWNKFLGHWKKLPDTSLKTMKVYVRIMEVEWLGSNIKDFYNYLN